MRNYKYHCTADGYTRTFNITFPYLRRNHVHVFVNGNEKGFRWVNPGTIELYDTPPASASIRIERQTPTQRILNIQDNRPTPASDYNDLVQQALYRAEEMETDALLSEVKDSVTKANKAAKDAENFVKQAQNAANQAQLNGQTNRDFAARWASDPEDGELINDGKNQPNNSAYHWAMKSHRASDLSQHYSNKAQDILVAASAAFTGYPNGSLVDLGHVTDNFKLFDTDLGNV